MDRFGLDEIDQKTMLTILEKFNGGPAGLNTIAASTDEEPDTIEEVYVSGGAQERSQFRRDRRVPGSHGFGAWMNSIKQNPAAGRRRPDSPSGGDAVRYSISDSKFPLADVSGLAV